MNDYYEQGLNVLKDISWMEETEKDLLVGFVEYLRVRNK